MADNNRSALRTSNAGDWQGRGASQNTKKDSGSASIPKNITDDQLDQLRRQTTTVRSGDVSADALNSIDPNGLGANRAWEVATILAQNEAGEGNDFDKLRDEYFNAINNDKRYVAADFRKNKGGLYQALDGIGDFLDTVNTGIGSGLDWGIDRFGDLAGWVTSNDDVRDKIQNWTTGEDLAWIPSVAEDVLLTTLGPAGWAAAGAKGLIDMRDPLYQGFTGKDLVTGEDLTGGQQALNLLAGLGGTALSFLPGGAAAKTAKIGKAAKGVEASEAAKTAARTAETEAQNAFDAFKGDYDSVADMIDAIERGEADVATKLPMKDAANNIRYTTDEAVAQSTKLNDAIEAATANAEKAENAFNDWSQYSKRLNNNLLVPPSRETASRFRLPIENPTRLDRLFYGSDDAAMGIGKASVPSAKEVWDYIKETPGSWRDSFLNREAKREAAREGKANNKELRKFIEEYGDKTDIKNPRGPKKAGKEIKDADVEAFKKKYKEVTGDEFTGTFDKDFVDNFLAKNTDDAAVRNRPMQLALNGILGLSDAAIQNSAMYGAESEGLWKDYQRTLADDNIMGNFALMSALAAGRRIPKRNRTATINAAQNARTTKIPKSMRTLSRTGIDADMFNKMLQNSARPIDQEQLDLISLMLGNPDKTLADILKTQGGEQ